MTIDEQRNLFPFLNDEFLNEEGIPSPAGTESGEKGGKGYGEEKADTFPQHLPRTCLFEFYDDGKTSTFKDLNIDNLLEYLDRNGINYFAILHDRDTVSQHDVENKKSRWTKDDIGKIKKPHYHFYIHSNKAIRYLSFCRDTGVSPNQIIIPRENASKNLQYFLHIDDKSRKIGKTEYSIGEIISSYTDEQLKELASASDDENNSSIIDQLLLVANGSLSYYDFLKMHPSLLYKSSSLLAIIREFRPNPGK